MNTARNTVRAIQAVDAAVDDGKRLVPRMLGTEIEQAPDFGPEAAAEVDMDFQPEQPPEQQQEQADLVADAFGVDMKAAVGSSDLIARTSQIIEKIVSGSAARRKAIEETIAAIAARRSKRHADADAEYERDMAIAQTAMKQANVCFEGADLFRRHVAKNK